jgi:hypothetical protein
MTTTHHDAAVRHDGRDFEFAVPDLHIPSCEECGAKVFSEVVDDQMRAALRAHLHLLTPEEMR